MQPLDSTTQNAGCDARHGTSTAASVFEKLLAYSKLWFYRRAAIKDMESLPDRLLQDAGIARSDIWRVADESARKMHKL